MKRPKELKRTKAVLLDFERKHSGSSVETMALWKIPDLSSIIRRCRERMVRRFLRAVIDGRAGCVEMIAPNSVKKLSIILMSM